MGCRACVHVVVDRNIYYLLSLLGIAWFFFDCPASGIVTVPTVSFRQVSSRTYHFYRWILIYPTPTGPSFYLTTIVCYFPPIFRRPCVLSLGCFAFNTINEQAGSISQYLSDKIMTLYNESYHGQQLSSRVFIILTLNLLLFSPARHAFLYNFNNFIISLRIF